jgi:hypothetical protein
MIAITGRARDWLALRSRRSCACGDVFYTELGRSNGSVGHSFALHIKGKSKDEAFDDGRLEFRQSHSSEEALEQVELTLKAEGLE